ncbi:MAG: flavin reductase family protein [Thalassobaculum sp.]|uniref:flavin reductase family protein n=1 Tax=Thalassobaculum sp. TaxID=2022740 RepID=UPI0032EBE54A
MPQSPMKDFLLADMDPVDAYKVFRSVVTPRPVALVTTLAPDGTVNAAPFSFFNAIAFDPCMVVLGVDARPDRRPKDTSANIRELPEFVVNIVDFALAERMNLCALPLEPGESEIDVAGLETAPSVTVRPPRIVQAPAALECRRHTTLQVGNRREIIVGEVLRIVVRPDLVDDARLRIDQAGLDTVGRLGGDTYTTTRDRFEMPVPKP